MGTFGDSTRLELAERNRHRRYTRIDGDYLAQLCDALAATPALRERIALRPNSSLCRIGDRLRYAMRQEGEQRSYSLIEVEATDYLVATLERARPGALPSVLAAALCDDEVSLEEARTFIAELVTNQVLCSELAPLVTGEEALDDVIRQLAATGGPTEVLRDLRARLRELDHTIGHAPALYRDLATQLATLPVAPKLSRLFQVNLVPVASEAVIGPDLVEALTQALEICHQLARPRENSELRRFREAFERRYESREVPLDEVLDEESGIGFAPSKHPGSSASPLLRDIAFAAVSHEVKLTWDPASRHLSRRLFAAISDGASELVLDATDLEAMRASDPAELPDSVQVMASVSRTSEGELRLHLKNISPSGASLLGRFAHSDPAMEELVREIVAAEQVLRPELVYAEIAHLPHGRHANLPRIRIGPVVLREQSWTLDREQLGLSAAELRADVCLPRWINVEDGDNVLPVDLENELSFESFHQLIKAQPYVTVFELAESTDQLLVTGPDGHYASELVVPFVRTHVSPAPTVRPRGSSVARTFVPGSEWLYAKLYCGEATADHLLTELAPFLTTLPRWFFMRYDDPDHHLRIRVHGEPRWLFDHVLPRLSAVASWKLQLDTYEREVERYGGAVGIELAERLFHADSCFVIDALTLLRETDRDARWRLTACAIDRLFDDLAIDLPRRRQIVQEVRDGFAREHRADVALNRSLGAKYRKERVMLERWLDGDYPAELRTILDARSRRVLTIAEDLAAADLLSPVETIVASYVHMLVNRMSNSAQRAHELVLYDLILRTYTASMHIPRR